MRRALRIGIAGLGTVGRGVLDIIFNQKLLLSQRCGMDIEIGGVSARHLQCDRGHDLSQIGWYANPVDLACSENIDVFVELMGGEGDPARLAVGVAIDCGKHVVTANKALLAHEGMMLTRKAEMRGVALKFEAAVGGAIPIVKTLRDGLAANHVSKIFGILNGTCNYILTEMAASGLSFTQALKAAQQNGYAEADPSFDVGGIDTAHKLALLAALAFGTEIDLNSIEIEGIENICSEDIKNASELGYKIKLLGIAIAHDNWIEQRVHPALVPKGVSLFDVDGVFNAVVMKGDFSGDIMIEGRGAGGHPTASAVVGDLIDIARGNYMPVFGIPASQLRSLQAVSLNKKACKNGGGGSYYIALELRDQPGAMAAITRILGQENISIETVIQHGSGAIKDLPRSAPVVLLTHDTHEISMRAALEQIEKDGHVQSMPRMIRIERL